MGVAFDEHSWAIPPKYWRWATGRTALSLLLWAICIGVAGGRIYHARTIYDTPASKPSEVRHDGNTGHTHIDFGGQWVMGKIVADGHARELYDRNRQWKTVRAGFPVSDEPPVARETGFPAHLRPTETTEAEPYHDADAFMNWFMGRDSERWLEAAPPLALPFSADAMVANPFATAALVEIANEQLTPSLLAEISAKQVGGPLYPPIHGFAYAPLALLPTQRAYFLFQWICLGLAFFSGYGASYMSRGRIAWPLATTLILLWPGFRSGLDLGQNPALTLAIAIWGWALLVRGRETAGGMVWGLFAIKPVWGLAFVLVPLLMGRVRFSAAMAITGCSLAAATLPFTGIQTWKDWLAVGNLATATYDVNKNWVELSRDVQSLPRRVLLDFGKPEHERHDPLAHRLGWACWLAVVGGTAFVYLTRGNPQKTLGVGTAFLFLGGFLSCYRFMYYDSALACTAVLVLYALPGTLRPRFLGAASFADRRRLIYLSSATLTLVAALLIGENWLYSYNPRATFDFDEYTVWIRKPPPSRPETALTVSVGYYYPWDTVLIIALWLWLGVKLAWSGDRNDAEPPQANR